MQTITVTSGYMAWFWADDPTERQQIKWALDRLADGYVKPRGLYLFQCEKIDDLKALAAQYRDREDAGVELVVYEAIPA